MGEERGTAPDVAEMKYAWWIGEHAVSHAGDKTAKQLASPEEVRFDSVKGKHAGGGFRVAETLLMAQAEQGDLCRHAGQCRQAHPDVGLGALQSRIGVKGSIQNAIGHSHLRSYGAI